MLVQAAELYAGTVRVACRMQPLKGRRPLMRVGLSPSRGPLMIEGLRPSTEGLMRDSLRPSRGGRMREGLSPSRMQHIQLTTIKTVCLPNQCYMQLQH